MKVFLDISPEEQKERILKRNGAYMLSRFVNEWIPKEETYFDTFGIRKTCDLIFKEDV